MSSSASWVEYMMLPLGLAMPMGCVVGRLFKTVAVTVQKCAVLPLSAMAKESGAGGITDEGGPTETVLDRQKSEYSFKTLGWFIVVSVVGLGIVVGSPRRQLDSAAGKVRGRPVEMVLLPPFILNAVASSLWPAALRWQVSEV